MIEKSNELYELIKNEDTIHKKLHHKHIVDFLSSFEDEKNKFIILEMCPNRTLSDLMEKQLFAEYDECQSFIHQILNGVNHIHQNNVIHRDIKLGNIMLNENNQVKIGDFGLAIEANAPASELRQFCGTLV